MFRFFKPNLRKVLLFLLFSFICVGGAVQSFAFIDDVPRLVKPPFYDMLKPLNLWSSWIMFSGPIHVFGCCVGLWSLIKYFPSLGSVKFPVGGIIYSYFVSCWMVYTWDKWLKYGKPTTKALVFLLPIAGSLQTLNPFGILFTAFNFSMFVWVFSGFMFLYVVFLAYSTSIYGFIKLVSTKLYGKQNLEFPSRRDFIFKSPTVFSARTTKTKIMLRCEN